MPPVLPLALQQQNDFADPYAAQRAAVQNRMSQPYPEAYTPEEQQQRVAENKRMQMLGILGQLSGDQGASEAGGLVLKNALAARQPHLTDKGIGDPLTGKFSYNSAYRQERDQGELDKLDQLSAAARGRYDENTRSAADRASLAVALKGMGSGSGGGGVLGMGNATQIGTSKITGLPIMRPNKGGPLFTFDAGGNFKPVGPDEMGSKEGGNITEGERRAATLLKRIDFSQGQISDVLKAHPEAASPVPQAEFSRKIPVVGETAANMLVSGPRQRVESAQLDILDAALTLGTGQAYTREQLEGYRKSYFPQLGDDEGTKLDKKARLDNILEAARIAAGRAPGGINERPNSTPNANPAAATPPAANPAASAGQKPVRVNF